jgi:hypothetical protein
MTSCNFVDMYQSFGRMYAVHLQVSLTFERNTFVLKWLRLLTRRPTGFHTEYQPMGLACKVQLVIGSIVFLQYVYCSVIFLYFMDVGFSGFSHESYIPHIYRPPWFDYSNDIDCRLQIAKLLTMQIFPASFYFHYLRSKHSLQHLSVFSSFIIKSRISHQLKYRTEI